MGSEHGKDTYARSGVDYGSMDPAKLTAQGLAASTALVPHVLGFKEVADSRGESAHVVDLGKFYLASLSEGLGTKNIVADRVREITGRTHYDQIGRSTVATILNDLMTVGAHPLTVHAFWAAGSSEFFTDEKKQQDLAKGWAEACVESGAIWGGGESQTLSGIVLPGKVCLAGSATGIIYPKRRLTGGKRIKKGDAILFAPSTGIHDNGLTLARKIANELPGGYATRIPDGSMYGEALLTPSRLYSPLIQALFGEGVDIHYMAHITGHGWRKIMRARRDNLRYVIDKVPNPQGVFEFIQRHAGMDDQEMYGTYNMGAGYALFVPEAQAARARQVALGTQGYDLLQAGFVEKGPKEVVIRPLGIVFPGSSLSVR